MTPETLSEIKSLLEKATPGEWAYITGDVREEEDGVSVEIIGERSADMTNEDKELICALKNNAPELIEAVEQRDRYRAALEEIQNSRKKIRNRYYPHYQAGEISGINQMVAIADKVLEDTKKTNARP